jgi:hypothetical protein
MKITTAQLRQIIKEELEKVMSEAETAYDRLSDRIRTAETTVSAIEYDIENSNELTDEQKEELLKMAKDKGVEIRKKVSVPAFFPVVF